MQDINNTSTFAVDTKEIFDVEGWFAKEFIGALFFEGKKTALDYANTLCGNIAVFCNVFVFIFGNILQC